MQKIKDWSTIRIRDTTKSILYNLMGTRADGDPEVFDDTFKRLMYSYGVYHRDIVKEIFPLPDGEEASNERYLEYYLSTTPEQREKDALEARKQKENYYSLKNTQGQEQLEKESM